MAVTAAPFDLCASCQSRLAAWLESKPVDHRKAPLTREKIVQAMETFGVYFKVVPNQAKNRERSFAEAFGERVYDAILDEFTSFYFEYAPELLAFGLVGLSKSGDPGLPARGVVTPGAGVDARLQLEEAIVELVRTAGPMASGFVATSLNKAKREGRVWYDGQWHYGPEPVGAAEERERQAVAHAEEQARKAQERLAAAGRPVVACGSFKLTIDDGEQVDTGCLIGDEPCEACGHELSEHPQGRAPVPAEKPAKSRGRRAAATARETAEIQAPPVEKVAEIPRSPGGADPEPADAFADPYDIPPAPAEVATELNLSPDLTPTKSDPSDEGEPIRAAREPRKRRISGILHGESAKLARPALPALPECLRKPLKPPGRL